MSGFAIMKKQHLSSLVAGQGILVSCIFMCFSINFQTSSCDFFVFLFVFPDEIAFSSILRIKRICFGHHSILCEKKSQLASNFKLMHSLTIIHIMGWVGTVSSQMDWERLPVVPLYADARAYCSHVKMYCKRARLLSSHPWLFIHSFIHLESIV